MYLEKLEIQGFKSFARASTLVFNRELTAIVGPNGSGKSNIADAVRWVLGEQSAKTLRGKKSDDVIFAGSDKKGKLGYAQVDLYLNNHDRKADIDYEQVIISRKIDRKGESEYLINNNKVRLLDVQLLLAQANFGQKTYSVIGQGMIDSILTSSAAERKEFFDEATGVKQFQIKKDQAISKLEHSKENLEQTDQILAELEPRLKSLTRQVNKLERREGLEKELQELQNNYYSFLLSHLENDLASNQSEHDRLKKIVSSLNQELVVLQTNLDKHSKADSRQDKFQNLQDKLKQEQNELNSLLKEKTILEAKADLKLLSGGKGDLVWLKNRQQELVNLIQKNRLFLNDKNKELVSKKEVLAELENKQQAILAQFKDLEKKLQEQQNFSKGNISEELEKIVQAQDDLFSQVFEIKNLEELGTLRNIFDSLKENTKRLWHSIKESPDDQKINWQLEFNKLLGEKDNLVSEVNSAKTEVTVLEHSLQQIKEQISQAENDLKKIESDLQTAGSNPSASVVDQQLKELEAKIEEKEKLSVEISQQIAEFNQQEETMKSSLLADQKRFRELQSEFNSKNNELNEVKVLMAKVETKKEDLDLEILQEAKSFSRVKFSADLEVELARQKISSLKNQLSQIGAIDQGVLEEYEEVNQRFVFLSTQVADLNEAIKHLEKVIKDLEETISQQFDEAFQNINQLFSGYFKKLFNGGRAQLILDIKEISLDNSSTENQDDLSDDNPEEVKTKKQYGIEILATPPGKKLSGINMLSGGEKALTSIALICAIIANNPSPFVVLDEVDAALDEANSIRLADILAELSDKTQFIGITHNRALMHKAKIIYGVTMGDDGISNLLSINFDQADEIAA
ncbi:AAA family ATPase [Candidatus Nomurabacteria bacterium]|nr:AAA family ATPase [Candidatus Nomurabacteria bacterium]